MAKVTTLKIGGRDVAIKADRQLYGRLLATAQTHEMNMRLVFSHSHGPVPWSLASPDGSMAKTTKSKLLKCLEKNTAPVDNIPLNAPHIIDGMAVLHGMKTVPPVTFGEMASEVLQKVVRGAAPTSRVDFIVDTYPEVSIKNIELGKRASMGSLRVNITGSDQRTPKQWKKIHG